MKINNIYGWTKVTSVIATLDVRFEAFISIKQCK